MQASSIIPFKLLAIYFVIKLVQSDDVVNVEYHLYAHGDANNFHIINNTDYGSFAFERVLKYIVLCHGWNSDINAFWYAPTVNNFMQIPNYVVIKTGYAQAITNPIYPFAVDNVRAIGEAIGHVIAGILRNTSVPATHFEIVGHSLGAHVAGYAGSTIEALIGAKIGRIFGLDPAGLEFYLITRHLQMGDAGRVIILHTSLVGLEIQVGDLDFYPNGGISQGQCGEEYSSDHVVATYYFYCSVNNNCINVGILCDTYANFVAGDCDDAPYADMGYWIGEDAANGTYYLNVTCI